MFKSKAGKSFGSAYVAKRHDDEADKKAQSALGGDSAAHEAAETPEFEAGEQEGRQEKNSETGAQVAAEHGPATTVTVSHDYKNKKHHVVSTHRDGHVHQSDHDSAKGAHDEATQLAGGDQEATEPGPAMGGETAAPMSLPKLA